MQKGLTFEGAGRWTVMGPGKIGHDHRIKRGVVVIIRKTLLWHFAVNVYNRDLPSEVAHGSLASQAPPLRRCCHAVIPPSEDACICPSIRVVICTAARIESNSVCGFSTFGCIFAVDYLALEYCECCQWALTFFRATQRRAQARAAAALFLDGT